jgi:hypothetical protein
MNKKTLLLASGWAACTAAAFWAGSHFAASQDAASGPQNRLVTARGAGLANGSGPDAGASGETGGKPDGGSSLAMPGVKAVRDLTPEQVTDRATEIMNMEDPIAKMEAWLAFMKGLQGNEQMASAMAGMMKNFNGRERGKEFSMMLTLWSRTDPEAALAWSGKQDGWVRERGAGTIISEWAKTSPDQAVAWAQAHPPENKEEGNWYMVSALNSISKANPVRALELAQTMDRSQARGEAMNAVVSQFVAQQGNSAARTAVENLPESAFKTGILSRLAARMAETDPGGTAQWALNLTDKEARPRALTEAIDDWAEQNPNDAGAWLNNQPRTSEMDEPRERFAWKVQEQDPESAIAWANTITNERRRNDTAYRLAREWMQRDPENARAWVTASALPEETKVRLLNRNRG